MLNYIELRQLDEIREETMIFKEMYEWYIDAKISRFDKEARQVGKFYKYEKHRNYWWGDRELYDSFGT